MTPEAFFSQARLIRIFVSRTVESVPPELSRSLPRQWFALLRYTAQHSSCSSPLSKGYIIRNTSSGEDTLKRRESPPSENQRRESSKAAAKVTALLGPTPSVSHKTSTDIPARSSSLPSTLRSSVWATSRTLDLPVPVLNNIARSSALLSEDAPLSSIFSLGLSSAHKSFSFIVWFLMRTEISGVEQKKCCL